MAFGTKANFDAVRELAFGSVGASYAALGSAFTHYPRIIGITNSTDVDVYISFDGSTNQLRLAANSFKLYDVSTNRVRDDGVFFPIGTQIYAKRVSGAPSTGAVWAEVMYGFGGNH